MKQKIKNTHVIRAQLMAYLNAVFIDFDDPQSVEEIKRAFTKTKKPGNKQHPSKNNTNTNSTRNSR